jgi:hypothetical protein
MADGMYQIRQFLLSRCVGALVRWCAESIC